MDNNPPEDEMEVVDQGSVDTPKNEKSKKKKKYMPPTEDIIALANMSPYLKRAAALLYHPDFQTADKKVRAEMMRGRVTFNPHAARVIVRSSKRASTEPQFALFSVDDIKSKGADTTMCGDVEMRTAYALATTAHYIRLPSDVYILCWLRAYENGQPLDPYDVRSYTPVTQRNIANYHHPKPHADPLTYDEQEHHRMRQFTYNGTQFSFPVDIRVLFAEATNKALQTLRLNKEMNPDAPVPIPAPLSLPAATPTAAPTRKRPASKGEGTARKKARKEGIAQAAAPPPTTSIGTGSILSSLSGKLELPHDWARLSQPDRLRHAFAFMESAASAAVLALNRLLRDGNPFRGALRESPPLIVTTRDLKQAPGWHWPRDQSLVAAVSGTPFNKNESMVVQHAILVLANKKEVVFASRAFATACIPRIGSSPPPAVVPPTPPVTPRIPSPPLATTTASLSPPPASSTATRITPAPAAVEIPAPAKWRAIPYPEPIVLRGDNVLVVTPALSLLVWRMYELFDRDFITYYARNKPKVSKVYKETPPFYQRLRDVLRSAPPKTDAVEAALASLIPNSSDTRAFDAVRMFFGLFVFNRSMVLTGDLNKETAGALHGRAADEANHQRINQSGRMGGSLSGSGPSTLPTKMRYHTLVEDDEMSVEEVGDGGGDGAPNNTGSVLPDGVSVAIPPLNQLMFRRIAKIPDEQLWYTTFREKNAHFLYCMYERQDTVALDRVLFSYLDAYRVSINSGLTTGEIVSSLDASNFLTCLAHVVVAIFAPDGGIPPTRPGLQITDFSNF